MHLRHPVAKAVEDHASHDRMAGIERVATAAVVDILTVRLMRVVGRISDPAPAERGTVRAGLGGVIEDDVEDDLDAGAVEGLDHVAELVDRRLCTLVAGIRGVRCEERHGLIAPVVDQACRRRQGIELHHGQQLDRGDPQVRQIGNASGQAAVGAPLRRRQPGAGMGGHAPQVGFVDDALPQRMMQRPVALPVVALCVHDDALERAAHPTGSGRASLAPVATRSGHTTTVGIKQDGRLAGRGRVSMGRRYPVGIDLAGTDVRHEQMPPRTGPVSAGVVADDARGRVVLRPVEEQQIHGRRFRGVEAEAHAAIKQGGPYRRGRPRPSRGHWSLGADGQARGPRSPASCRHRPRTS